MNNLLEYCTNKNTGNHQAYEYRDHCQKSFVLYKMWLAKCIVYFFVFLLISLIPLLSDNPTFILGHYKGKITHLWFQHLSFPLFYFIFLVQFNHALKQNYVRYLRTIHDGIVWIFSNKIKQKRTEKFSTILDLVKLGQLLYHVVVVLEVDDPGPDPLREAVQVSIDHGKPVVHHNDRTPVATVPDATAKSLKFVRTVKLKYLYGRHTTKKYQWSRLSLVISP